MSQQQILGSQAIKDNSVTPAKLTFTPVTSTQIGVANGVASLDSGGKIPASQIPNISITSVTTVVNQTAMTSLTAEAGDMAIRTDLGNQMFVLASTPASTLANWKPFVSPSYRTDTKTFTANGSQTLYALTGTLGTFGKVTNVWFDGVLQTLTTHYTVATTQVTTGDTLPSGTIVSVAYDYLA